MLMFYYYSAAFSPPLQKSFNSRKRIDVVDIISTHKCLDNDIHPDEVMSEMHLKGSIELIKSF